MNESKLIAEDEIKNKEEIKNIQEVTISAGTAFKIGFFASLGASVVSFIVGLIIILLLTIFGASLISSITTEITNRTKIENLVPTLSVPSFFQNLFNK